MWFVGSTWVSPSTTHLHDDLDLYLLCGSLDPHESAPRQLICMTTWTCIYYVVRWSHMSQPLDNSFAWRPGPVSTMWFVGPTWVSPSTTSWSVQPCLHCSPCAQHTEQTSLCAASGPVAASVHWCGIMIVMVIIIMSSHMLVVGDRWDCDPVQQWFVVWTPRGSMCSSATAPCWTKTQVCNLLSLSTMNEISSRVAWHWNKDKSRIEKFSKNAASGVADLTMLFSRSRISLSNLSSYPVLVFPLYP